MGRELAIAYEFQDEQNLRDRFWRVEQGDVVIDIGCGYGSYTVPALTAGATVYAVDANEAVLDVCAKRDEGAPGTLVALHLALYNGGQFPVRLMEQIERSGNARDHNHIRWTTLDTVVAEHNLQRVDWVKIDVEGGEAGVLRGGLETLRRFRPFLLIEDHSGVYPWVKQNRSAERIRALLATLSYRVEVVPYVGPGPARNYFVCVT